VGAGALGVGEAGQGDGCGQVLHQFFGLAAEELVGLAAADEHRLAAARRRRQHAHPGPCREPPEQPGTGNDTPRATTSDAAGDGARFGNGPHGPDHRTTLARMARRQQFNLSTCAVHDPACGPGLPPCPWRSRLITG